METSQWSRLMPNMMDTIYIRSVLSAEKAMTPHSSTLAWKIPWTEEPGGLPSLGSHRVGHDWSDFTFTFHFHSLEKEMATHSSVLAWRIPGTGEPGGLPSLGSHRVGHDWSDLAAAFLPYVWSFKPLRLIHIYQIIFFTGKSYFKLKKEVI